MTIASEITRLQWAKADIKTAIENKWVTVWNITLDNYAACIDAIPVWPTYYCLDLMLVWWGWAWWQGRSWTASWAWWWWAGWVVLQCRYMTECMESCITIWAGGIPINNCYGNNGWNTTWFWLVACWWWGGWGGTACGCSWWSGWWGGGNGRCRWEWIYWQWNPWWIWYMITNSENGWWGGGWAWWAWSDGYKYNSNYAWWWKWWDWICTNFSWTVMCIAWGWWGSGRCKCAEWWMWWWGCGVGCNWTCYWAWWWGRQYCNGVCAGCWYQWVAIVRYPADWSYWINSATWWTVSSKTIDGKTYCVHCFTSDWTFTIVG